MIKKLSYLLPVLAFVLVVLWQCPQQVSTTTTSLTTSTTTTCSLASPMIIYDGTPASYEYDFGVPEISIIVFDSLSVNTGLTENTTTGLYTTPGGSYPSQDYTIPGGAAWGGWAIEFVGASTDHSCAQFLKFAINGPAGETVAVKLRDSITTPGSEPGVAVPTTGVWEEKSIPLSSFTGQNMASLKTIFVFALETFTSTGPYRISRIRYE